MNFHVRALVSIYCLSATLLVFMILGTYSLTVKYQTSDKGPHAKNYRIVQHETGGYYIDPALVLPSVRHLIDYYKGMGFS